MTTDAERMELIAELKDAARTEGFKFRRDLYKRAADALAASTATPETKWEYTPAEFVRALDNASAWIRDNVHKSYGCAGCEICTHRSMIESAASAFQDIADATPVQVEPESTAPEQEATTEREWSIYSESSDTRVVMHHEMKLNNGEREQGWRIETREVTTKPWLAVSEEGADLHFPQRVPKATPKPEEGAEQ